LQLGERISRWDAQFPDVRASLQASIVELPVDAQTQLAALGFQVADEILRQASAEVRELQIAEQVEQWLPYGEASLRQAERILPEMPDGKASWLFRAAARVAAQRGKTEQALAWSDEGIKGALIEGNTLQVLDMAADKAWLLRGSARRRELQQTMALLTEY